MERRLHCLTILALFVFGTPQPGHAELSVGFNANGDLINNFAGYSDFSEAMDGGLGGTGSVSLTANSQVAVYQIPVNLQDGVNHKVSMYFKYNGADGDGGTGRGFFVGFTSGATDIYETSATTSGVDIRGIVAGSGTNNLYGIDLQNDGVNVDGSAKDIPLVIGEWYYLELSIAEVAPGELIGVTVSLYSSNPDGTLGTLLKKLDNGGAGGYPVTSTLADATAVFSFFGGQNPASRIASNADAFTYAMSVRRPVTTIPYGTPAIIDGAIDSAWDAQSANTLTVDIDGTSPAPDDLSGYWKAMWDEDFLYLLFVTKDDTVVIWPGSQFWNYDMTELFLDMDYSRNDDVVRYDQNDFQLYFPRDGQAARSNGPAPVSLPLNYAQSTVGTETVVEVALPWSELTVNPVESMPIGIDVYMKDNDSGQAPRKNQISWSPSMDQAWKNPSLFGTGIILGKDHPNAFIAATQAHRYPDGHYRSPWFGEFSPQGNWSSHQDLGWIFTAAATSESSFYLWSHQTRSWIWSSPDTYPICHDSAMDRWIYIVVTEESGTFFFDYSTGEWSMVDTAGF